MRLLVVEDDLALGNVIRRGLAEEGHAVDLVGTVAQAEEALFVDDHDLLVLDLGLPDGDGAELCRRLRAEGSQLKVLMLTARDDLSDKVGGLDAGADDYLTKPFAFPELAARVRALLRRPADTRSPVMEAAGIRLDPAAHTVWAGQIAVPLTPKEFSLLHYLMAHTGDVVSRSILLEHVWDANYDGLSNVVDVHVANLRRKLELPGSDGVIETVRGVGYRFNP
ncbi:MAG TPA: response regulator transcription factor [Acidimicrobiales bacterium]|nr:response regulator transcription factor [Acidimicrobiales bacterium]